MKRSEMIYRALSMWANYVETGDVVMSAKDAERCKMMNKIKTLDTDQMRMLLEIKDLAGEVLSGEIKIL